MTTNASDEDREYETVINSAAILAKFAKLYRVLIWLLVLFLVLALVFVIFARPLGFVQYTANATIGPTDADTGGNLVSAISGASGLGVLSGKSILSSLSGAGTSSDFDQYTQTLTSVRLAEVLATKDNILPVIFERKWDNKNNRWYPRDDVFHETVDFVKGLLNIPVKPHPDVDDLVKFLGENLNVDTSYTSSFVNVSFSFETPEKATKILGLILLDADEIIRQDKRRDVSARMKYLEAQIPTIRDLGVRDSAISVLATQQQMMTMIEADKHYAAAFVDMPNASLTPTAPSIPFVAILAVLLSFVVWCVLIFWLPEDHWLLARLNGQGWKFPFRVKSASSLSAKPRAAQSERM